MKVAILGASGIGKNHARWFKQNGAEVTAFLGSSPGSVQRTEELLRGSIGFQGQGYTDLGELLTQARPDAVCISSPNNLHYEQAKACIEAGVAVLCEKPLVHDALWTDEGNLVRAGELVSAAKSQNVLLGMQTQYAFAAPAIAEMAGVAPAELTEFSMVMETKNLIPGREGRALWIDLAPHPLSVLQTLVPDAELVSEDIEFHSEALHSSARFTVRRPNGTPIRAHVTIGCVPGQEPERLVTLNGQAVEYAGFKDSDGIFKAKMWRQGGEPVVLPDFVDSLIRNFIRSWQGEATLAADGNFGLKNLEWLLRLSA